MRTLAASVPLSSFVGRERELSDVSRLLADIRLLTLTGPGGVGKTRLALEASRELSSAETFADGVWFAGLAPLADAALLPQTTAAALGVREEPGRALLETLQESLRARRLLLVLDNCEHLVEACADLADALLHACPRLAILATSREPLNIAGETVWPVPPLSVPPRAHTWSPDGLLRLEAVRLFVERARSAVPNFALTDANAAAVAEICTRLDGLPLAIELAAARVRLLGPDEIAARLSDRFRLLAGGARTAMPRHQTIRALVDWSYQLLPEQERTLFCRLGVFAGDWSLEAAEAVAAGDGIEASAVLDLLGHLVDKSLVAAQLPNPRREVRYRLLESLREYALERLRAETNLAAATHRHARYFLEFAERADARLWAGDDAGAATSVEPEHDNVRAALRHFLATGEAECAARLAGALGMFWFFRGHFDEGRAWLREVLGQLTAGGPSVSASAAYAKALHADGRLAHGQGDYAAAEQRLHAALAVWRQLEDRVQIANALFLLGRTALGRGERAAAQALFMESLACAEAAGDAWMKSLPRLWMAQVAFDDGDNDAARAWAEQVLSGGEATGSHRNACFALRLLGDVDARQGNIDSARKLLEASLAHGREVGRWLAAWPAADLADLLIEQRDYTAARALLREALITYRDAGDREGVAGGLEACARLAATVGLAAQVVRLAGAAAALRATVGTPARGERTNLDRHLAGARATLGPRVADAAWAEGLSLPPPQATAEALALLDMPEQGQPEPASVQASPLTPREREVAALVARGLSNRGIARELVITEATAERHIGNVFAKLGLASRAQLAVWALEHGLLQGNP
jgi:predicted ATPase/DNA-binding CsgD family transcriptional regulator